MRRILKIAKFAVLGVIVLSTLLILTVLGVRQYRQTALAERFVIDAKTGINEAGYVRIGGVDQWLQVRGQDRRNPVLLCLHGGPGATWLPFTELLLPWEKHFTVVLWDQRGAGKTLHLAGAQGATGMNLDQMSADGIEVADYLRHHLAQDKIILLGHSFGSLLGVRMIQARPDLFHAYVGTGQTADMPKAIASAHTELQALATRAGDQAALRQLQAAQPPLESELAIRNFFQVDGQYLVPSDQRAQQKMMRFLSPPPGFSLRDEYDRTRGFLVNPPISLYRELLSADLTQLGSRYAVPILIIQGDHDRLTPIGLVEAWLAQIDAPSKELIPLDGGGHFAFLDQDERFLQVLLTRVRPLAVVAGALPQQAVELPQEPGTGE